MFSPIHKYGVTRSEYYALTGITPEEKRRNLLAEVSIMEANSLMLRRQLRRRPYASPAGRYISTLLRYIEGEIARKSAKAKEIENEITRPR